MSDTFGAAYLVVFAALVIGVWLFGRKQTPKQKKYWHPRLALLSIVVIGPWFLWPLIQAGFWLGVGIGLAFLGFIGYVNVTRVRVCEKCGNHSVPQNLVSANKFCPKCGEALSQERLFKRERPTGSPPSTPV